jgi:hypothetical protein
MFSTDYPIDYNNVARIGLDQVSNTQRQIQNSRYMNHMLAANFSESLTNDTVQFASQQPAMTLNGLANGTGLNGVIVDADSALTIGAEQERPLERLQLMQRPFATIPYLGKGSVNPDLESQLLQGESVFEKKGIATVMTQSFMPYIANPVSCGADSSFEVEEYALGGWTRGGINSREAAFEK